MNLGDGMAGGDNNIQKAQKGADRVDETRNNEAADSHAKMLEDVRRGGGADATTNGDRTMTRAQADAHIDGYLASMDRCQSLIAKMGLDEHGNNWLQRAARDEPSTVASLSETAIGKSLCASFEGKVNPNEGAATLRAFSEVVKQSDKK
jgi:hypothetical protein